VGQHHALPYWQKGLLVCQMTAGERDQAELGLALMRERGTPEDPGFLALVEVLRGGEAEVPTATAMEPLNFAALQSVGWQPPAALVNRGSPGLLAAIARSPQVPLEERAVAAEHAGADYVAFGTPFSSVTKPPASARRPERSLDIFRQAKQRVTVPVFAISGITLANAPHVIAAGADGLSVVSAVFGAPDVGAAARALAELFE